MPTSPYQIRRLQFGIRHLLWVTFVLALILGVVRWLSYCQPWREPKFRTIAEIHARERQSLITEELSSLRNHEWAGEYYCGDGLGVNLRLQLTPKSGFVFHWHGCLGLYDRNYGPVHLVDGVLQLRPMFDNTQGFVQGMPTELIPVRWGDRCYLIPPKGMDDFCHAVKEMSEPRDCMRGSFLLRRGDSERRIVGSPPIPTEFQHLLEDEDIEFLAWSGEEAFEQMIADASKELLPEPLPILPTDHDN